MKIKRYMAESMRAALAQVRTEQGPDAVILSSRRVDEGIEVIAAVDYDEALFADAVAKRPSAPIAPIAPAPAAPAPIDVAPAPIAPAPVDVAPAPMAPAPLDVAPTPRAPAAPAPVAVAPAPVVAAPVAPAPIAPSPVAPAPVAPASFTRPPADPGYLAVQRELKDLRQLLHDELARMTWNDKRLREPQRAQILEQLQAMDIAPDVAFSLAARSPRPELLKYPALLPIALIVKYLRVVDDLTRVQGGVIALVGPTGVGKTTTIAKLAARWSMKHGSQDLALVSTDGYRIGAREHLMTYARILGAPMHVANDGRELARVLERLRQKKLVLIDTAGMGPRDARLSEQLAALQLGAAKACVMLALPAQSEGHALEEIVKSFAPIAPAACILTKVDEAASLGAVISTALRHRLKIAYLCNGQRVPEDLHPAHERRVWLVRAAAELREHAKPRVNDPYLARHFGGVPAHA